MLYYLFQYLNELDVPGAGVFQYITFRAAASVIVSLLISMVFGKRIIEYIKVQQVGETIRDLGLEGQNQKAGTPTMGGLIILASILIPTLLFAKLHNIYVILMLVSTVLLGAIGFADDYIKVFKKNKQGLAGKFKVVGQVIVGLIVGCILYFHEDVVVKEKVFDENAPVHIQELIHNDIDKTTSANYYWKETKSFVTTIPFVKDNEFDYAWLVEWMGENALDYAWLIFIPIVIIIVTAVSNGANMTDGLDGLATGTSAIIGVVLAIFAYVSGNTIFADYLNIMGDTGSLALGGIIAVFALAIRKELLIPVFCGIFLVENLSVMIQVAYFKYTKKKFGEGRRVFLMAPLHHHYQKKGYHEAKIVSRFWIVGIMLAILSIVTLKLR